MDLVLGGDRDANLDPQDVVGAYRWWNALALLNYEENWKDNAGITWHDQSEAENWWNATKAAANALAGFPSCTVGYCPVIGHGNGYVSFNWSPEQVELLNAYGLTVNLPSVNVIEVLANQVLECTEHLGDSCFVLPIDVSFGGE